MRTRSPEGKQVGVGPLPGPPDPAAQLVELAEAEQVGPVDDEGVHRRHVDARLDDRRADEDVVARPRQKSSTTCSRVPSSICPWATATRASGTRARSSAATFSMSWHAVVDEEDLALAQQLAADRLGDGALVVLADVGEDRLARGRRRVDEREVADAR